MALVQENELDKYLDFAKKGLPYDEIRKKLVSKRFDNDQIQFIMYYVDKEMTKALIIKMNRSKGKSLMIAGLLFFAVAFLASLYTFFFTKSFYLIEYGGMIAGAGVFFTGRSLMNKTTLEKESVFKR